MYLWLGRDYGIWGISIENMRENGMVLMEKPWI
jgi:hypothetical protein